MSSTRHSDASQNAAVLRPNRDPSQRRRWLLTSLLSTRIIAVALKGIPLVRQTLIVSPASLQLDNRVDRRLFELDHSLDEAGTVRIKRRVVYVSPVQSET